MKTTKEKRKQWKEECEKYGCIQDLDLNDEWAKKEFLDLIADVDELEYDKEIADSVLSRFRLGQKQDEEQALHQSIIESGGGGWRVQQARGH